MSGGVEPTKDWRRDIQKMAMTFSGVTVQNFRLGIAKGIRSIPVDTQESRVEVVNAYMDALACTVAAMASEVMGSPELATEEQTVKIVKEKFRTIRQNILVRAPQGGRQ